MNFEKQPKWLVRLILVAVVFAVFARTLTFEFVSWDDGLHIYENPALLQPSWAHLAAFWTTPFKGLYIPLTYSAWNLVAWLSPGGAQWAAPFHLLNLFVHSINVLFIFEILGLLGISVIPAFLGAALFAIHPLQVESVAWATAFKELFFGFFALASIWVLLKKRSKGLAFVLSVAAALCKPTGVVLPLLFAWLELDKTTLKELAKKYALWTLLLLPVAAVAISAQPQKRAEFSIFQRLAVAGDSYTFYLLKLVFPYPLLPQYDHSLDKILFSYANQLVGLVVLAILAFVLIRRKPKALALGLGAFVIPLLPVAGFVPFWYQDLSTVSDHYVYLSMFGIALLLALILEKKRFLAAVAAGLLLVSAAWSSEQSLIWKNGKSLAEYTLRFNPNSPPAHLDLGLAYRDENKMDLAIEEFKKAIELEPGYGDAYVDLGCAYAVVHKYPEAVEAFSRALEIEPFAAQNHFNLAKAMTYNDQLEAAVPHFQEAIRLNPEGEADVQNFVGDALKKRGNLQAAELHYEKAREALNKSK